MAAPPSPTLTDLLTLEPGQGPDEFVGHAESYGAIGIYGGHLLGQALAAGLATVAEPKLANSLHGYFLRAGDGEAPITYRVARMREGRTFDTRTISAIQHEQVIFHMLASFKADEAGEEHQKPMPDVPRPDALIQAREAAGRQRLTFPMTAHGRVEMEMISDSFAPPEFLPGREPVLQSWMRVPESASIDERMAQCMLAFLADGTLMFNSVLPYGLPFRTHRLTSLDQSVWFHRHCDVADWMLYDQRSIVVAGARGLNEGEVFDPAGNLVLSAAQESMLRRI